MSVNIRRMKTPPPPGMKKTSDWMGVRVRTLVMMRNGYGNLPEGTLATVVGCKGGVGLALQCDPCACCKIQYHINRVNYRDVEIVNP